jgi:hypothetical protein
MNVYCSKCGVCFGNKHRYRNLLSWQFMLVKQKECCRRKIVIDQFSGGTSSRDFSIALEILKSDVCERNVGSAHFIQPVFAI